MCRPEGGGQEAARDAVLRFVSCLLGCCSMAAPACAQSSPARIRLTCVLSPNTSQQLVLAGRITGVDSYRVKWSLLNNPPGFNLTAPGVAAGLNTSTLVINPNTMPENTKFVFQMTVTDTMVRANDTNRPALQTTLRLSAKTGS